jgi:hypothetical protein
MGSLGSVRPNYGSYRVLTRGGYWRIWEPSHPLAARDGYVREHRKVLFDAGIDLRGLVVHHINGDPQDNRLENLQPLTSRQHRKIHEEGVIVNQHGTWPVLIDDEEKRAREQQKNKRYKEARVRRGLEDPDLIPHGATGYGNWGCRCSICLREGRTAVRRQKARRKDRTG